MTNFTLTIFYEKDNRFLTPYTCNRRSFDFSGNLPKADDTYPTHEENATFINMIKKIKI